MAWKKIATPANLNLANGTISDSKSNRMYFMPTNDPTATTPNIWSPFQLNLTHMPPNYRIFGHYGSLNAKCIVPSKFMPHVVDNGVSAGLPDGVYGYAMGTTSNKCITREYWDKNEMGSAAFCSGNTRMKCYLVTNHNISSTYYNNITGTNNIVLLPFNNGNTMYSTYTVGATLSITNPIYMRMSQCSWHASGVLPNILVFPTMYYCGLASKLSTIFSGSWVDWYNQVGTTAITNSTPTSTSPGYLVAYRNSDSSFVVYAKINCNSSSQGANMIIGNTGNRFGYYHPYVTSYAEEAYLIVRISTDVYYVEDFIIGPSSYVSGKTITGIWAWGYNMQGMFSTFGSTTTYGKAWDSGVTWACETIFVYTNIAAGQGTCAGIQKLVQKNKTTLKRCGIYGKIAATNQYYPVFVGCTGMTTFIFGPQATSTIGTNAFSGCAALKTIYDFGPTPVTDTYDNYSALPTGGNYFVPQELYDSYTANTSSFGYKLVNNKGWYWQKHDYHY